tara:strand:- start:51 stop:1115 length:1065 start_codon:yes stop_codon:yes gene_type:complete
MKRGVVFDMDKCIGYFTQIALYQDIIEELSRPLLVKEYYELFDMFPMIFRPGIFNVFRYLKKMKKKGRLEVIMYTNNNGPPSWATNIRKYIEHKIKHKLFDRTIKGWKYNNKIVEEKRKGYEKSWEDLLDCTRLTKNDKVIFFDDRDEHYKMRHRNVDYQKVKPYRVGIKHDYFVNKFVKSKLNKRLKINKEELIRECNRSRYNPRDTSGYSNNDIMKPLVKFMKSNKKKTRRIRGIKNKKTRRRRGGNGPCQQPGITWDNIQTNKHYNVYDCFEHDSDDYILEENNITTGRYRVDEINNNNVLVVVRMGEIDDVATQESEYRFGINKDAILNGMIKFNSIADGGEEKVGEIWD